MLHQDLVLKHNELYLVGEDTSDSSRERATGLYLRDTRFLSFWDLRLNGTPLEPLEVRVLEPDRAVLVEANGALAADGQRIAEPICVSGSSSATTVAGCCHCRFPSRSVLISAIYSTFGDSRVANEAERTPHPSNCPLDSLSATPTDPVPRPGF